MKCFIIILVSISATVSFAVMPKRPKLGPNEFAVFRNEKYEIVKIRSFNKLELDDSCFKNKGKEPICQAYKLSLQKFNLRAGQTEYAISPASEYCKAMSGKSFVGISNTGAESDLCFFGDGSIVKSWSAYFLHYPPQVIK